MKFLLNCRDAEVFPTNVKWKILKKFKGNERKRYYERNLQKMITEKRNKIRSLKNETIKIENDFRSSLTWMKYMVFKISISRLIDKEKDVIIKRHELKLDKLIITKASREGLHKNPNDVILNLSGENLSQDELDVLNLGLKYGIALRPKEEDIFPIMEAFYSKLSDMKIFKDNQISEERIKNALRSFAYNTLDIENKRYFTDSKVLKTFRKLKERMVIVKPDKGQGIVLLKKEDYVRSLENIFNDETKFKKVDKDPTLTRIGTIKTYLNTMFNRGEITSTEKKSMRPKGAIRARARGMPKTHKNFTSLPSFRPVIDTMNTPYYGIGHYLNNLLQPIAQNSFTVKDSFKAAETIQQMDFSLLSQGYSLVSFDVVSLFTNVPLKRTINVILDRIYKQKLIETKIKKTTMKKLIIDCCTKSTFSFNDKLYEQTDGVCMGSSLGPTLANIIMTEMEKEILPNLLNSGIIKSYIRYVDDTLVMLKTAEIDNVLRIFNTFDENLKFTVDRFDRGSFHFLDIAISYDKEIDVFVKPTNTGQYTNFNSFAPWHHRISWAAALYTRGMKLCSTLKSKRKQISRINKLLSWNDFPNYIRKKLLFQFKTNFNSKPKETSLNTSNENLEIILKLPYMGPEGEKLVKNLRKKITRHLSKELYIKIIWTTNKLSDFCGIKDKIPTDQRNNIIYKINCPACGESYIGKTECCFRIRMNEHGTRPDQPMHQHLTKCPSFSHVMHLFAMPSLENECNSLNQTAHIHEAVLQNSFILKHSRNWLELSFMESYLIKKYKPKINHGIKAAKELQLF